MDLVGRRARSPDWLVIDLDPEAGDVEGVRAATLIVRDALDSFGLTGTPLATGSKGFHVWIRLDGTDGFDRVSLAARALAGLAVTRAPEQLTTEFLKKDRKGRVFVDWLRAAPTATVVVPFSLRPRPGAPVAVPLRWEELADARPDGWRLGENFASAAPSATSADIGGPQKLRLGDGVVGCLG